MSELSSAIGLAQNAVSYHLSRLHAGGLVSVRRTEALLRQVGGAEFTAHNAGSHPKPLHPNAVRVMREYGIDISDQRAKHLDDVSELPQ